MSTPPPPPPAASNETTTTSTTVEKDSTTATGSTIETTTVDPVIAAPLTIQLTLTSVPGQPRVPLDLSSSSSSSSFTASELRHLVSQTTNIPLDTLRLIHRGRLITDQTSSTNHQNVITAFQLEDGSVVHCMGKPVPPVDTTVAAAAVHATTISTSKTTITSTSTTTSSSATSTTLPPPPPPPPPAVMMNSTTTNVTPATATTTATNASTTATTSVSAALEAWRRSLSTASPTVFTKSIQVLAKMLQNILTHPHDAKYRTIKVHNPVVQKHFASNESQTVLRACGFVLDNNEACYTMPVTPEQWSHLLQSKAVVDRIIRSSSATNNSRSSSDTTTTTTTPVSLIPPPPARPPVPSNNNMATQYMNQMLSNPQQMSALLQVCVYVIYICVYSTCRFRTSCPFILQNSKPVFFSLSQSFSFSFHVRIQ